MWNLEGECVEGKYIGVFPCAGRVTESRVAYGGSVKHTVRLFKPITVYGGAVRERVILDAPQVTRVFSNPSEIL